MSSEAKKIRVFEPDCLTAEEKKFAVKIKNPALTYTFPRQKGYYPFKAVKPYYENITYSDIQKTTGKLIGQQYFQTVT